MLVGDGESKISTNCELTPGQGAALKVELMIYVPPEGENSYRRPLVRANRMRYVDLSEDEK